MRRLPFVACLLALAFPLSTRPAAQTVTRVSAGEQHTIFVKSDGSLWGMGDNSLGQLGLGSTLNQTNLPQEIISSNVSAIAAGAFHSLILESNRSLWATGNNQNGELGDGSPGTIRYIPEQIVSSGVTGIAAGGFHSLFTTITNESRFLTIFGLSTMGWNFYGQLGDSTTTERDSPEQVQSSELLVDIVSAIAAGYGHSLYVRNDGTLWTTGYNQNGQLGDATTTSRDFYAAIISSNVVSNVVGVAAGYYHSLFIKSDTTLWAMGDNTYGELGDGLTNEETTPEQVATNVNAVAAGYDFSLFIKSDGSLWGMGENTSGQLGIGTNANVYLPVLIVASNVVAVAAGNDHSFFIKSDGTLWAMGDNSDGELGDGTVYPRYFPVQVVPLVIPQPVVTGTSLANTNLVLSGTNGESGRNYITLMSTNLTLLLSQWTRVATNFLTTDGPFFITATNAVNPNAAQAFCILQAQAAN